MDTSNRNNKKEAPKTKRKTIKLAQFLGGDILLEKRMQKNIPLLVLAVILMLAIGINTNNYL